MRSWMSAETPLVSARVTVKMPRLSGSSPGDADLQESFLRLAAAAELFEASAADGLACFTTRARHYCPPGMITKSDPGVSENVC